MATVGNSTPSTSTLDGKDILREGWLTVYKSRNPTFLTKQKSDKVLERAWGVIHTYSSKGPLLSFFQDSKKTTRVLKREKLELMSVRLATRVLDHPKHDRCFTLKMKGKRNRLLFDCDSESDLLLWLGSISEIVSIDSRLEKVIWEYLGDDGLWQSLPSETSFSIEGNYCDQKNTFGLGSSEEDIYQYNLGSMNRFLVKTKQSQRIKRTLFVWDKPETLHQKMKDLPAIWEWGDPSKDEWHPFERDTNMQIEDMYDCGSQWAELTLCIPSPMLLLLNLQDMKLVNSRTSTRYCLRRVDNSANMAPESTVPTAQSPSDDEDEGQDETNNGISPVGALFQPVQTHLQHLQLPRKNVTFKRLLGEGAFGEVYLSKVTGLEKGDQPMEVAVKQLRLSDFIARHGHHSQQMEDFLREAKEMAKVDHHRVVKLLAVCTLDFPLLLIEEYMNQGDLLGVLKDFRPSMPLELELLLSWQVADGMNYLAIQLQCVHRDLAARNVMVNKGENGKMIAKIADFGLSRHLYSEMYKHQGSKPRPLPAKWMALESLMYFVFSTRSDVWSFGVLLWEIMTLGRTPYPGVENRELLEQIEEHGLKLSRPKSCPLVLYELILDCTKHEPEERPTFLSLKEKLFSLHGEAKAGTLVLETESVSEDVSSDEQKSPQTSNSTDEKKGEPKSSVDTGDKPSGEDTGKEDDTLAVEETKKTEDMTEGASDSKEDTETQEVQCHMNKEPDETFEIIVMDPKTSKSPVHKEPDGEQTSTINLEEIKIADAIPGDEEDKEPFYYVIDDLTQVEKPDHKTSSVPPNGTLGDSRT